MLRVLFTYRVDRVMEIEKMITKKEDLMNTHIANDYGELRQAYIDKAIDLGYEHQDKRERKYDWYDLPYIGINDSWDDTYVGQTADTTKGIKFSESKLISISDLKPRTKTEFVKCEFKSRGQAFDSYDDEDELYVVSASSDTVYSECHTSSDAIDMWDQLYRKVETEIDERQEFIEMYAWASQDDIENISDIAGMIYDSGKFKLVEK